MKNRHRYGFIILLFVAFLVRFWGITEVGLWHDEALSHHYALQSIEWIISNAATHINHPPLYFLLLKGWLNLGPTFSQSYVELLNVLFGVGTVAVFFFWSREVFSSNWSLVLTAILALHPFHVKYSGVLRMYTPALFFFVIVGWFTTRLVKNPSRSTDWIIWVFAGTLSVYTHSFSGAFFLIVMIYLGWSCFWSGHSRSWFMAVAGFFLLYGPWLYFVIYQAVDISSSFWIPSFHWAQLLYMGYWWGGYVTSKVPGAVTLVKSLLVCLTFFAPLAFTFRKKLTRLELGYWFIALGPLAGVLAMSLVGQSVFLARTQIFAVPFLILLVGTGLQAMNSSTRRVVLAGMVILFGWEIAHLKIKPAHQYVLELSPWIEQYHRDNMPIVHAGRFTYYPSIFYNRRELPEHLYGSVRKHQINEWRREGPVMVIYFKRRMYQAPMDKSLIDHWKERFDPTVRSGTGAAQRIKMMILPEKSR